RLRLHRSRASGRLRPGAHPHGTTERGPRRERVGARPTVANCEDSGGAPPGPPLQGLPGAGRRDELSRSRADDPDRWTREGPAPDGAGPSFVLGRGPTSAHRAGPRVLQRGRAVAAGTAWWPRRGRGPG